jgi:hypothetical protein
MSLKFKVTFYNVMIFLIIFDIIYILVWAFSIKMSLLKALIVAVVAAFIMPWARHVNMSSGKKVIIWNLAYVLYKKYRPKVNSNKIQ